MINLLKSLMEKSKLASVSFLPTVLIQIVKKDPQNKNLLNCIKEKL
jgi:hypothetical protein